MAGSSAESECNRDDILPDVDHQTNTTNEDKQLDESNKAMGQSRRRLIKALASGGAIVAAGNLPSHWSKPVVDAVMLPAHAQTSPGSTFYGSQSLVDVASAPAGGGEILAGVLDALVPRAQAGSESDGDFEIVVEVAVTIVGDGKYEFVIKWTETYPCKESALNGEFSWFHSGTGTDGVEQSPPGTNCGDGGGGAITSLTVDFEDGFLRVFGHFEGAEFDFPIFPGGNVPTPSPCVMCPDSEQVL